VGQGRGLDLLGLMTPVQAPDNIADGMQGAEEMAALPGSPAAQAPVEAAPVEPEVRQLCFVMLVLCWKQCDHGMSATGLLSCIACAGNIPPDANRILRPHPAPFGLPPSLRRCCWRPPRQ
jgi:hypothetical protein